VRNPRGRGIRSIYVNDAGNKMLVSTFGSQIHLLDGKVDGPTGSWPAEKAQVIMTGHYASAKKWTNEVWGIDTVKKDEDKFVSCSDDGTLRMYSIKDRKQVRLIETTKDAKGKEEPPNKATGDPADSTRARRVGVSRNGQ
jgi:microtubule-associated protein-like 6